MTQDLLTGIWTAQALPSLDGRQWESLLGQARRARLAARLPRLCAERGWMPDVPARVRVHLDNARREAERLHDQTLWEADRLAHALAALPGPVVLLKGAAYVLGGLPPGRARLFTDIDVMVPQPQLRTAEGALLAGGWIPSRLDPYDERYYRRWMHELPPLTHIERQTSLDLHHTITPPTSRWAVAAQPLFAAAQPLARCPGLAVLAPCDMVLHSAVHLMQEGDFSGGLRDLLDLADLLQHFGHESDFWPRLLARAAQLGLLRPLADAAWQIERLLGVRAPSPQREQLVAAATGGVARRFVHVLLAAALRPDHPDCDTAATPLARWLLYVRSHWLRMPWHQIVPHLARKAWMRTAFRWRPAQEVGAQRPRI